jgi:hypothetical protein
MLGSCSRSNCKSQQAARALKNRSRAAPFVRFFSATFCQPWTGDEPQKTLAGTSINYEQIMWMPLLSAEFKYHLEDWTFGASGAAIRFAKIEGILPRRPRRPGRSLGARLCRHPGHPAEQVSRRGNSPRIGSPSGHPRA